MYWTQFKLIIWYKYDNILGIENFLKVWLNTLTNKQTELISCI